MIAVLTGPIQTGKTTALRRAFADARGLRAHGVLQPVIDERRHILSLASGEVRLLEAEPREDVVQVGRFAFSAATLTWARACIDDAVDAETWLVIDEIGPLELRGEGLAASVVSSVERAQQQGGPRLLLVVRQRLLDRVIRHFELDEATVVRLGDTLPGGPRLTS